MPDVEFRVLGPLEVAVDSETIPLGPRPRMLLAVLLMEAGRVIPADRLIELLWGDPPPRSARATLRTHIATVRRTLAACGKGHLLVTRGGGYALHAAADQVDALRFQRQVREAGALLAADRPRAALAALDRALDMWRGPAWADLADSSVAIAESSRLERLRRAARQDRAAAMLALGRHADAIDELEPLLGADPYSEEPRRLLAIALYRARGVEAAARVCQEGMELLVAAGLDSPRIQELHRDILRHAPYLAAAGRPDDTRSAAPQEIPRGVGDFVGRANDLAALRSLLDGRHGHGPPVAVVHGPAGVGKSTLVIRMARLLQARFPDGCLYSDLHGSDCRPIPSIEAVRRLLHVLGVRPDRVPADMDGAACELRSRLSGRRALLILDDAGDAMQVRPLLPGSAGCAVLVTSRRSLKTLESAAHLRLGTPSIDEAVELLARVAGRRLVSAEPDQARRIVMLCDRLPLAVRIAGIRLAGPLSFSDRPLRALAGRLADERRGLDEFQTGDLAVRPRLAAGLRGLRSDPAGADAFELFRLMGGPPLSHITGAAAATLAGLSDERAEAALARLVDEGLLEPPLRGRYRIPRLARRLAREQAGAIDGRPASSEPRHPARRRLTDQPMTTPSNRSAGT